MNDKILNILKDKECIPDELADKITKIGVRTGSIIYGGKNINDKTVDVDIIIPPNDNIKFNTFCQYFAYTSSEYRGIDSECCFVKLKGGHILNLIFPITKEDFNKWFIATELCIELYYSSEVFKDLLKDRINRHKIFEAMKEINIDL